MRAPVLLFAREGRIVNEDAVLAALREQGHPCAVLRERAALFDWLDTEDGAILLLEQDSTLTDPASLDGYIETAHAYGRARAERRFGLVVLYPPLQETLHGSAVGWAALVDAYLCARIGQPVDMAMLCHFVHRIEAEGWICRADEAEARLRRADAATVARYLRKPAVPPAKG